MIESVDIIKIKDFFIQKVFNWPQFEDNFLMLAIVFVLIASVHVHDSILAIASAVCGIIYTVLAGKGRVSCYFFGIIGTLCCTYISYQVALYGSFVLHLAFYFPMEILGFFTWKKHLDKATGEVIKETLSQKERLIMVFLIIISTILANFLFVKIGDKSPFIDSAITVLSVAGMILTVKRAVEQWLIWILADFLSIVMWFEAYAAGEKIFSIFFVRIIYFILGIYFFIKWETSKTLENQGALG